MKVTRVDFIAVALCVLSSALSARPSAATSFVPHTVIEEQQMHAATAKHSEGIICLFHDVIHQILGQDFSVFRNPAVEMSSGKTPVGTVRLTESRGAHYLEAVIIEGELKAGDVVHLRDIYALVVLTNSRCETSKQPNQEPEQ